MAKMIMVLWRDTSKVTDEEKRAIKHEAGDVEFRSFYPKTPEEHAQNCKEHQPVAVLVPEAGFFRQGMEHTRHVIMGNGRKARRHLYRITKEKHEVDGIAPAIARLPTFPRGATYYNKS